MGGSERYHIICERDVGLFALVQQAIANIAYARETGAIPIVYFGRRCSYWTPSGYRDRDTVWEYYFEPALPEFPVSILSKDLRLLIDAQFPEPELGYYVNPTTFVSNNYKNYKRKALPIPHKPYQPDPDVSIRTKASVIIRQHVRPRAEIEAEADKFFTEQLKGRPTIGVHLRGTDALVDPKRVRQGHHLDFSAYKYVIEGLLRAEPASQLFVASDSETSVEKMRQMFGDRVIASNALRHKGGPLAGKGPTGGIMPAYLTEAPDLAALSGEEALIDYLLLSRCSALVHNGSSLSRTVMLNVPSMPVFNTTLRRPSIPQEALRRTKKRTVGILRAASRLLHL